MAKTGKSPGSRSPDKSAESKLGALLEHRFGADVRADEAVLLQALRDPHYRVVAKAAELAEERLCYAAMAALKDAFRRFLEDPLKKDPQCIAKQAIVRALVALDCSDASFFIAGLSYRQMEPGWGPPTDSAVDVRTSCAMGLVNSRHPRALHELTSLLNDSEMRARMGAIRAIACGKPHEAELLLRFKASIGDIEPEVMGECFAGLIAAASVDAVPIIAPYLSHANDAIREHAALALGESQLPEALVSLRHAWEDVLISPERKRILTRAIALQRSDAAFDWLIGVLVDGSLSAAEAALEALSIYKERKQLTERIKAALVARGSARLDAFFEQRWI